MIEAALYAGIGCAACSALFGNRTAWVLLASVAFGFALDWFGVPFHPVLWMLFDAVVVLLVLRRDMSHADCVIIALFAPIWVFYELPDPARYEGAVLAVTFQLLLTAPIERVHAIPVSVRTWFHSADIFDKLVAHVRLAGAYA